MMKYNSNVLRGWSSRAGAWSWIMESTGREAEDDGQAPGRRGRRR
uniref:Uncharacterized protein n=1 Tax=Arundo donax TaxID=35708 RepID=A0A0A8ZDZ0_ARUDO